VPYVTAAGDSFERAGRLSHSAAAVQAMADHAEFFVPADALADATWVRDVVVQKSSISGASEAPSLDWAIAIDGSHLTQQVRDGMPSVLYGFAQAAAALVDLAVMTEQSAARFVDPIEMERAVSTALVTLDLPVAGAYSREGIDIKTSWRELMNRIFREKYVEVDGFKHSLLELLFRLHGVPGGAADSVPVNCPDCSVKDLAVEFDGMKCPGCTLDLYPTDSLRIHEGVQEDKSNEESLGRLRSVIELLVLVGLTTLMWERSRRFLLPRTLFIQDGPLAMYGEPAKLRAQAERYFRAMANSTPGEAPYICGVEKSGAFVDYGRALARHDLVQPGEVVICGRQILEKLVSTNDPIAYGKETYWGRKFIYRSLDSRVVVITVPPFSGSAYDARGGQPGPDGYPTLPAILDVIDRTGSSMYQDGIIPVAAAHGRAAFPIGVGTDVLRLVAREKLGLAR
jgi:hypothetical protein